MTYEDIISWAEHKIKQQQSMVKIPGPISIPKIYNAENELALECAEKYGNKTPQEILEKDEYIREIKKLEGQVEKLTAEIINLKTDVKRWSGQVKHETFSFIDKVYGEIAKGEKGISTFEKMRENLKYIAPNSGYFDKIE
ncbi:MAG: hypothetical protein HUJ68_09785 [Clostridia bacterium]|nr:hypothetical protein [Clostridia bacterium]